MKTKTSDKRALQNWRLFLNCCAGTAVLMFFSISSFAQTPVILAPPQNQNVAPGATATFSVTLSNTGPFTYQWQFDGTNLPNNLITTIAGNGSTALTGDGGQATNAGLSTPYSVARDASGNLFIADLGHNCIRMINPDGIISTVAGNGGQGFSGNGGQATNANLNSPTFVVPASGMLYIDDYANNCIRKVDTNGIITTIAGNGTSAFSGDGGPATSASLSSPDVIALDNFGNLFIADFRNNRIRKVDTNGIITTVAGSGPTGVGMGSYSGDGGPATSATFFNPAGLALDASGNIFIADTLNNRIREVDTNGIVTTVAGNGTAGFGGDGGPAINASINNPYVISVDPSGNLFIADNLNNRIREVDTNGIITTIAGNGQAGFSGDGGPATAARLNDPGVDVLNGHVYISDFDNNRIRQVGGSVGPNLTLFGVTAANVGGYTVVVSGPSGSVTSSVAQLNLIIPPCAPVPSGIVGWWPAEGNANDTVGGNNGALSNGASFGPGEVGQAFKLNGINQYVTIPDAPALRPSSLTVEGWYNFQAANGLRTLVAKPYGPGTFDSFTLWLLNGQLQASILCGGVQEPYLTYNWSPAFGVWHHIAYTYDQNSSLEAFYVDGAAVVSNSLAGAAAISYDTHPFVIGADIENGYPSFFFPGSIDEVSLYSRALTAPEIASIYDAGAEGKCMTPVAPTISVQPQDEAVAVGGMAELSVSAIGTGPLSYQWSFDGANISGAADSSLVLTNVGLGAAGSYTVIVSNAVGSMPGSNAVLTVGYSPTVTISPSGGSVVQGTNVTFTASATGTAPLNFQWFFNGAAIAQETNSALSLTNIQPSNAGAYAVKVTSPFGTGVSPNAVLSVALTPIIGSEPQSQSVVVGNAATFSVAAGPASLPVVNSGALRLWLKADAGVVTNASGLVSLWQDQSGNTNNAAQTDTNNQPSLAYSGGIGGLPTLRFNGNQDNVHGSYLVGNGDVGLSNAMTSFVVYNSFADSSYQNVISAVGQPPTYGALRCDAIVNGDMYFSTWTYDYSFPYLEATNLYHIWTTELDTNLSTVTVIDNTATNSTNFSTTIHGALTPAPGYYVGGLNPAVQYVVNNRCFDGDIAELIFYRGQLSDADRLAVQGYLQQKYFEEGGSVGDSFQWQFDGTNIAGATNATLTITNVQGTDAGTYTVIVTDPAGSTTSSNAVLTVGTAPSIATQPQSQEVGNGTSVLFTVAATGTLPLSYQWTQNGVVLAGATNSVLSLADIQAVNAGVYAVTASNPFGTATSSNAVLAVDSLPVIEFQPQSQAVVSGGSATLSIAVAGTESLSNVTSGTLQLWLKADAGIVTNASGQVSLWQDQSGNTNNASQTDPDNQPLLVNSDGIGGKPALRFNGNPDNIHGSYLAGSGEVGVPNAMTTFAVYSYFSTDPNGNEIFVIGQPPDYGSIRADVIYQGEIYFSTWTYDYGFPFLGPSNTFRIWTTELNTNLGSVVVYDNTATTSNSFSAAVNNAVPPAPGYYVGGLNPSVQWVVNNRCFDGDIAELICYRGQLSDGDRMAVQNYLQQKYFQTGVASGDTFQWQFDGTNIAGATNATLTLANIQGAEAGVYTVIVTDPAGSTTSSNAVLSVLFPAVITSSPTSQSVSAGATVTFNAAATGTPLLSYQWQFDGSNIAGATNASLTVANVTIASSGSYTMVASNPYGSATSLAATLAINESTIQAASIATTGNSTVVVPISLVALGTESGVGFSLDFDPSVLTYVGTSLGSGATGATLEVNANQVASGRLGLGAALFNSVFPAGTNDVFDVTFQVAVVTNATSTSLTFGNQPAGEQISDASAQALPAVYLPGVVVVSPTTLEGDVSPAPHGNGAVDITDWIQEGRFVAGLDVVSDPGEFQRADCAPRSTLGDGQITVADWVQVGRYAVGIDPLTAAGGPTAPEMQTTVGALPGKTDLPRALQLVPITQGLETSAVAVELSAQGDESALQFSVTFNPTLVHFVNATLGAGASSAALIQNTNQASKGALGFVVGLLAPKTFATGAQQLVNLNFTSVSYSNTTSLEFGGSPIQCQLVDSNAAILSATYGSTALAINGLIWPVLTVAPAGNNINLSWPSSAGGFGLQAASALGGIWTNVVAAPVTNGDTVILSVPKSNDTVYYRLKY